MAEPRGCIYDEEETYYEDNDGGDYPVNPFDEFCTEGFE